MVGVLPVAAHAARPARPGPSPTVALSGNLETMPLADLVQFLGLSRKTGVVCVESPHGRKRLILEDGQAVFCSSDNAKEYLGQQLLARTHLTEADLEAAFRTQKQTGQRLGQVLVGMGLLTEEELKAVLRHKVEDAMYEMFTWQSGTFDFQEGGTAAEDIPVRLAMQWADLVMEGARRTDEMARIRQLIPGPHVRLVVHRDRFKPGFPRTGGDKRLIELAEEGLSVGEMLPRFHASDFDILARMAVLVRDGSLEADASAPMSPPPLPVVADDVLRRAMELQHAERIPEAWLLLKEADRTHHGDPAIASSLAACEARLRRHFAQQWGDGSSMLALRVPLERLMDMPLDSKEAFLASRVTGDWPLSSVVQICPFDELEALCLVEGLLRKGLVELRAPVRR